MAEIKMTDGRDLGKEVDNLIRVNHSAQATAKPKRQPVVATKAIKQHPSFIAECVGKVFSPGGMDPRTYLIDKVIVPMVQKTIFEGIQMLLFSRVISDFRGGGAGEKYTPYSQKHSNVRYVDFKEEPARRSMKSSYQPVIFSSRRDGESVLNTLFDVLEEQGYVTVSDLYDLAGIPAVNTDFKFGWKYISDAKLLKCDGGWTLSIHNPSQLF